jgi:hypothetical protein
MHISNSNNCWSLDRIFHVLNSNQHDTNENAFLTVTKLIENGSPMMGDPFAPVTIL